MIAKLIVHDRDRDSALRRLRQALRQIEIVGPASNVVFLHAVADHPAFVGGDLDTGFIDRHKAVLLPKETAPAPETLALAALALLLERNMVAADAAIRSDDPTSPWGATDGWRLNGTYSETLEFMLGDTPLAVQAEPEGQGFRLRVDGRVFVADGTLADGRLDARLDGRRLSAGFVRRDERIVLVRDGAVTTLGVHDPLDAGEAEEGAGGSIAAPLPGKIIQVLVAAGEAVSKGKPLVVLEAMKMEHTIAAAADCVVETVHVAAGDLVTEGATLIALKEAEG